jgi:tetratricopeptide (TPR) repeat protein
MNESRLDEATRLEETEKNFEAAIARMLELVRDDPTCIEAYVHLAADSGMLKRYRQAEIYARAGLRINPDYGRARYYLACALRDQLRLEEAYVEMEKALILVRRTAYPGSIAERLEIQLPLFGWNKHVEEDAMNLRMLMLLPGNRKRGSLYDTPNFTPKSGGMKTYRNDRHGFEIDLPADWQAPDPSIPFDRILDPIGKMDPHDFFQFNSPEEAFNFVINPLGLEPALENTEAEFMIFAQDHHFYDVVFGRIRVGGREHVTAHYHVLDGLGERWNKKYMVVFGGIEYSITGTCNDGQFFAGREGDWDAIVRTFRLLVPLDDSNLNNYRNSRLLEQRQDFTERRLLIRQIGGVTYGQAYDAVTVENYRLARSRLAQCLKENPDHLLARKEMAVVLKKLGDKRGALRQRREVKRLEPADKGNRVDLVNLLAGCGFRKEAGREADELIAMNPNNDLYQQLKAKLPDRPNYQVRFLLSLLYLGFVIYEALTGGFMLQVYWLAAIGCVPAAHYFNQSGPWMGLNRNSTNWLTMMLYLLAVMSLLYMHGMGLLMIVLFFPVFMLGMAVMADNQLKD